MKHMSQAIGGPLCRDASDMERQKRYQMKDTEDLRKKMITCVSARSGNSISLASSQQGSASTCN